MTLTRATIGLFCARMALICLFCLLACSAWGKTRFEVVDAIIEQTDTGEIPKDVVRAICWQESGWRQWSPDGKCLRCNRDSGCAQVHDADVIGHPGWSLAKAKRSTRYNVWLGVQILKEKLEWVRGTNMKNWKHIKICYHLQGYSDMDLAVLAYNGVRGNTEYLWSVRYYEVKKPWLKYLKGRGK
jgi:hypothetical protein